MNNYFNRFCIQFFITYVGFGGIISYAQTNPIKEDGNNSVTAEMLNQIIENNKKYRNEGAVADYIPELSKVNPEYVALSVVTDKGKIINAGDVTQKFTIQSISKIIALMIAVEEQGEQKVFSKVGYYGTNKPFNHYSNLETEKTPLNPMMNAGAILITSMIEGIGEEPFQKILERIKYITKNNTLNYNKAVYNSERETGDRNKGIFYLLKNNGLIEESEESLNNYFKQCSIEVTAEDLAKIGFYFAHQCQRFDGDTRYQNTEMARLIQSQMLIAGMYDFSGEYARIVGLPSKSGVGGGIAVSVPGKMGIGVFSPALDEHGNSVVGYKMISDLSQILGLNLF